MDLHSVISALRKYKDAYDAVQKCTDMILSSGTTEEAATLMRELEEAREELFKFYY